MNEARGPVADFFGRLWRHKPLGIASAIVILILILLAIFADALAPYPVDQLNLAERLQGSSTRHLLGTDQLGRDLLSRLLVGATDLAGRWSGGDHAERGGRHPDRWHLRIPRGQAGPGRAAVRRCLDGVPGAAAVAHDHVDRGAGSATDHRGAGDRRRRGRLARGQRRGGGHQGERFFFWPPGRSARRRDRSWCATSCPTSWRR